MAPPPGVGWCPDQTGPEDHLHQCGLKTTVLDWCTSSPINTATIVRRCPRFPLGRMVAHGTEVSGVRPTYLRTRAKDVVAMFVQTAYVLCPLRKVVTGRGVFLSDAPLRTMPPNKKAQDITPEASSFSLASFPPLPLEALNLPVALRTR